MTVGFSSLPSPFSSKTSIEIVAGVVFSIPYANTVPVSAEARGFSLSSLAVTTRFKTSSALTNELLPAPFGPIIALVLIALSLSFISTTLLGLRRLSLRASKLIV